VGRELQPVTVWRQFPALLFVLAVEPRVLSHNTAQWRFQIRHLYWILFGPSFAVSVELKVRALAILPEPSQFQTTAKKFGPTLT
jgi:hypothetical protein